MHALATKFAAGIRPGARRRQAPNPGDRTAYKEIGSRLHEYPARQARPLIHDSQSDHPPRFQTNLREQSFSKRNSTAAAKRRATGGVMHMKNSTAMMPTTVGPETPVGKELRAKLAAVLIRFPSKQIEAGGDLSDEGVRLLKNGRRTVSSETLIKLARAKGELGPAVWKLICELCERPGSAEHESPRLNSLFGALHVIAKANGPVGEFASAMIREMNAGEEKRPPAPSAEAPRVGYDPNGAIGNLFDFTQQQRRRVHGA